MRFTVFLVLTTIPSWNSSLKKKLREMCPFSFDTFVELKVSLGVTLIYVIFIWRQYKNCFLKWHCSYNDVKKTPRWRSRKENTFIAYKTSVFRGFFRDKFHFLSADDEETSYEPRQGQTGSIGSSHKVNMTHISQFLLNFLIVDE